MLDYKLFTYGTLRVNQPNSSILDTHGEYQETCRTKAKYIMFCDSIDVFPYIIPIDSWPEMAHKAVNITGDLYNITLTGLKRCDKLEGHPTFYVRTPIEVETNSGTITVFAYILSKDAINKEKLHHITFLEGDWLSRT